MAAINDPTSGVGAAVDLAGNLATRLAMATDPTKVGGVVPYGESHDGGTAVARILRPIDVSHDFRTRVGVDTVAFSDTPGLSTTVPHPGKYRTNNNTAAVAAVNGFMVLNASNSVGTSNYVRVATYAEFAIPPAMSMYIDIPFVVTAAPAAGQVFRFGRFRQSASATTDADDGVYFELTSGGVWQGAAMFNGAGAAATVALTGFTPTLGRCHLGLIVISQYLIDFYVDGELYGQIQRPIAVPDVEFFGAAPLTAYLTNGAAGVSSATQLRIGKWAVTYGDGNVGIDYAVRMALSGNTGLRSNAGTGAPIANITNSAAPASATLSNTAAGYALADGNFQWAAVAGAETDYALFAYLNPAPGTLQRGQNMVIGGARISMVNKGAANSATVPTVVQFYLGVGSTAVSLATADSATAGTRAPSRTFLGQIQIPVSAAIDQAADREINVRFTPQIVEPGTYSHIIARVVSGAATASQIVRGVVALDKYWME